MNYKISVIYAWAIFTGTLITEILVDYVIRKSSEHFYANGINETLWFFIQIIAAIIFGFFLIKAMRYLKTTPQKITHLAVNSMGGLIFYTLSVYGYILGLGIDSL